MSKKPVILIIIASVVCAFVFNLFFGRWITAKVSTLPLLNRLKLLSPQAPIVINTREEVRISDSGEVMTAINSVKSKISSVAVVSGQRFYYLGGAINLTSDGLFLTTKNVISGGLQENLRVKLDDGTVLTIDSLITDPATNLVIIKAKAGNVQVANVRESKNAAVGQKAVLVAGSFLDSSPNFQNTFVTSAQLNDYGVAKNSDQPSRAFKLQAVTGAANGSAVTDMSGQILGLWDNGVIFSGDVIKDLQNNYFTNKNSIVRAGFGFKYQNIPEVQAELKGLTGGAEVGLVTVAGSAKKAGLLENDIITSVDGNRLTKDNSLEELLAKYKPGDTVKFLVKRGETEMEINIVVGELK